MDVLLKFTTKVIALFIFILFTACATIQPLDTRKEGPLERVYTKNYTLGKTQSCYIGEPVVKVVDYYVRNVSTNKLKASNDFVVSGGPLLYSENITGSEGDTYQILGTVKYGGVHHYAVNFGGNPLLRHFITYNGEFTGNSCDINGAMRSPPYFKIEPKTTRFLRHDEEHIETNRGYINYEIIYTGKSAASINLLYREFTSDNLAKPSFYQELTYGNNANVIRFKKLRIAIKSADNEMITYTVINDGM